MNQLHRSMIAVSTATLFSLAIIAGLASATQSPEPLTGNWVVRTPATNNDGTFRTTYLNLKQEAQKITGTIRVTQFFYKISESTGGPDGFTLTGSMMDGKNERKVQYEGKLVGEELHISTRRRPQDPPTQMVAVRAPAGEGAMPARNPLPALRKVADNGLARTPPMGFSTWNHFQSRRVGNWPCRRSALRHNSAEYWCNLVS